MLVVREGRDQRVRLVWLLVKSEPARLPSPPGNHSVWSNENPPISFLLITRTAITS